MIENKAYSIEEIYQGQTLLAFVIEGEVVQTFMCDERMAAVLQSNPEVVEITGRNMSLEGPFVGWQYDGKDFIPPTFS
jgi:hypothetical protein